MRLTGINGARLFSIAFALLLSLTLASAADPGHSAPSIGAGTFESGNYVFPSNLTITSHVGIGASPGGAGLYVTSIGGNANVSIQTSSGGNTVYYIAKSIVAGLNPLVRGGDASIIFTNGTQTNTSASFFIGPWSSNRTGIRITGNGFESIGLFNTTNQSGSFGIFQDFNARIGIGTTTPTHALDVNGIVNASGFLVNGSALTTGSNATGTYVPYTGASQNVNLGSYNISAGNATIFTVASGVSIPVEALTVTGTVALPVVSVTGSSPLSYTRNDTAYISSYRVAAGGDFQRFLDIAPPMTATGSVDSNIRFITNDNSGTPTERVRISGPGNVGIGTTNASYKLEVNAANLALNVSNFLFANSTSVGIGTAFAQARLHVSGGNILLDNNQYLQGERSDGNAFNLIGVEPTGEILAIGANSTTPSAIRIYLPTDPGNTLQIYNASEAIAVFDNRGHWSAEGNLINNVATPISASDAATKGYVDALNASSSAADDWNVSAGTLFPKDLDYNISLGDTIAQGRLYLTGSGAQDLVINSTSNAARIQLYPGSASTQSAIQFYNETKHQVWAIFAAGTSRDFQIFSNAGAGTVLSINKTTGSVGIGTSSPITRLHVAGDAQLADSRPLLILNQTTNLQSWFLENTAESATRGDFAIREDTDSGSIRFIIQNNTGRVGIGTSTPSMALDVRGAGNFSGTVYINNGTDIASLVAGADDWNVSGSDLFPLDLAYNVGIGTNNPAYKFEVNAANNALNVSNFLFANSTNVGIGTSNPTVTLQVAGTLYASSTIAVSGGGPVLTTISSTHARVRPWSSNGNISFTDFNGNGIFLADGGRIGIKNNVPTHTLDLNGTFRMTGINGTTVSESEEFIEIRALGAPAGATTMLGTFTFTNGAGYIEIDHIAHISGYSTSAKYIIPVQYDNNDQGTSAVWMKVQPISYSGDYSGQEAELDINVSTTTAQVRLRRASGAINASHTLYVRTLGNTVTFTPLNTSSTGESAPTRVYGPSILTQRSGRVGIGTTAPSMALDVRGAGNFSGTVYINNGTDISALVAGADDWNVSGSNLFPLDLAYNVGIGISSPTAKLYVNQSANAPGLYVEGGANGLDIAHFARRNGAVVDINITGNGGRPQVIFGIGGTSQYAIGYDGSGYFSISSGTDLLSGTSRIVVRDTTGNVGIGVTAPAYKLEVNSANSALNVSNFLFANSTNVGIGTSNPSGNLHVVRTGTAISGSSSAIVAQNSGTAGATAGIDIVAGNTGVSTLSFGDTDGLNVGSIFYDHSDNSLSLRTNSVSDRLVIDSAGDVGIGTASPTSKFEVVGGTANISGASSTSTPLILTLSGAPLRTPLEAVWLGYVGITGGANFAFRIGYPYGAGVNSGDKLDLIKLLNGNTILATNSTNGSLGNVGIGTGTPTHALDVNGVINASGYLVNGSALTTGSNATDTYIPYVGATKAVNLGANNLTIDTNLLHVDINNDRVGIGTTSPTTKLTVGTAGSNTAVGTIASFYNAENTTLKILSTANNNGQGPHLGLYENNGNLYGFDLWYDSGLNVFKLDSYVNDVKTEILTAQTDGDVGIGTSSPTSKLQVSSSTSGDSVLTIESDTDNNNENDNPWVHFKQDNGLVNGFIGFAGDAGSAFGQSVSNVQQNALVVHANNTDSASYLQLATNNSARVTITPTGEVGIGISTPGFPLEVSVNSGIVPQNVTTLTHRSQGGDGGPTLNFRVEDGGTAVDGNGETLGRIAGFGSYSANAYVEGARIDLKPENTFNSSSAPSYISFSTSGLGSVVPSERLRINAAGRVGIGTTTPTHALDVNGVINASGFLINGSALTTGSNATDTYVPYVGATKNTALGIYNLTTTGMVGIGTTAPTEKLDVAGEIKSSKMRTLSATYSAGESNQWKRIAVIPTNNGLFEIRGTIGGHDLDTAGQGQAWLDLGFSYRNGFKVLGSARGRLPSNSGARTDLIAVSDGSNIEIYIEKSAYTQYALIVQASGSAAVYNDEWTSTDPRTRVGWSTDLNLTNYMTRSGKNIVTFNGDATPVTHINSGNVGIGTTTPTAKLDVNGVINASGYLVNGSALTTGSNATDTFVPYVGASKNVILGNNNLSIGVGTPTSGIALEVNGSVAFVNTLTGGMYNTGVGSLAVGRATSSGNISAASGGSFAGGSVSGSNSSIYAKSGGSFVFGRTSQANSTINSSGLGSFAFGQVGFAHVAATGNGAFAQGIGTGSSSAHSSIISSGDGSFAQGFSNLAGHIRSMNDGSFAQGAASGGSIIAQASGASAQGYVQNANITASNIGASAQGAATLGANITASAFGSFAGGYATAANIVASGQGSFVWGNASSSSGNYGIVFGQGIVNTIANSFSVGFGNIGTTPTLFVNGSNVGIGTTTPGVSNGYAKLELSGTSSSSVGPHIKLTTSADAFPVFQALGWTHDNIGLNFDSYYDGTWRSADAGSNFQLYKLNDAFRLRYDSGITAGSALTWEEGIVLTSTGNVGIGAPSPTHKLDVNGIVNASGFLVNGTPLSSGGAGTPIFYNVSGLIMNNFTHGRSVNLSANLFVNETNVGIGTMTPTTLLHINGTGLPRGIRISTTGNTTSDYSEIQFASNGREYRIGTGGNGTNLNLERKFYIYDSDGSAARFVVDSSGNVGINTTSPQAKLHVQGDVILNASATGGNVIIQL